MSLQRYGAHSPIFRAMFEFAIVISQGKGSLGRVRITSVSGSCGIRGAPFLPHPHHLPFWSMAGFTLETDHPSRWIIQLQNPSKLTEKQMGKVRRIVHPKLRPFHFKIKTYYLSDANYPTDNPFQTDNPSQCEYGQYRLF